MKLFKQIETKFDNYDMTVRSYLSKVFNNLGMQYSHTQIFGVIFDGMKGIMENILFYIEDAFTEQNVETASRRQSIFSLAKIAGFEPEYGKAACGTIKVKLHINNGLNQKNSTIYINNHTKITNKNSGITYSIILPTNNYMFDISNPLVECEFMIVQGTFINTSYVAEGNELETVHISSLQLFDKNYITVYVDGVKWNPKSNIYDMQEGEEAYVYSIGYDNAFDIIFGNGIYGKKLTEGQIVQVEYLRHQGTMGNIEPVNEKYQLLFSEQAHDNFGNAINPNDYLDISINTSISGGSDADDIEFIRSMIGKNSKTLIYGDVESIKLFLSRFSFVGYNNAFVSLYNNIIYIIALQNFENIKSTNNYTYFNIDSKDMILTQDQKQMIVNTINNSNHSLGGFNIKFIEPIIRKYSIVVYAKINNSYNKDKIYTIIYNAIYDYFCQISYDIKFIAKSSIIDYILSCDTDKSIVSLDLNIISDYNEQAYYNQTYVIYTNDMNINDECVTTQQKYTLDDAPGLDQFNNILLNSIYEIPHLCGGFKYYINKSSAHNIKDYIITKPVQIYFI